MIAAPAETIRVLLVEDDETITSMLQTVLMTKKVFCHPEIKGLSDLFDSFDPHVVVLDYELKDGDAFKALRCFPNISSKRNIPIIYTAHKLPQPVQTQLHLLGVMNIIFKPTTISTLESIIENYYEVSMKYRC